MAVEVNSEVVDLYERAARIGSYRRERGCACVSVIERMEGDNVPGTEDLAPGQVRCAQGCGRVFGSWDTWLAFRQDVLDGVAA